MSTTQAAIEVGEARWAGGRVVNVYDLTRQAILGADVAIGATTLGPLDSTYPFNPAGGTVAVTLPEAAGPLSFTYSSVDPVGATLALTSGPSVVLTAGSVVRPDPALVDRLADVREGTQADPVACRVPYGMRPWLPVGNRAEGQGEEVLYGPTTGAGYVLHDVLGSVPLLPEGGSWVGDMPVGTIMAWGAPGLPARWVPCDGALYSFTDYPELGTLLGSRYGGDGLATFGVPNLIGRFARGAATPGGTGGADTHAHSGTGLTAASVAGHTHSGTPLGTSGSGPHTHPSNVIQVGSNGGHTHGSAGSHAHGSGGMGTGASNSNVTVNSGSGATVPQTGHGHDVTGSSASGGSHDHGSVGGHQHGLSGPTGDGGSHGHDITGSTANDGGHSHTITGTNTAAGHLPPYLELIWIIKATPGGDPLADGTYIEVRDEGIPDVPAAVALDFRGPGVQVDPSGPVAIVTIGAQAGVTDHGALTGLADDDHLLYLTNARGDTRYALVAHAHAGIYEPFGTVATHAAAADPHPVYLTPTEGAAAYEPLGAVAVHSGLPDPHDGYATDTELSDALTTHVTAFPDHNHPDLATHDGIGLATDANLASHTAAHNPHATLLDDLTDVAAPSPTSGQLLGFTGSGWANVSPSAGSHPDLATHDALGLATDAELSTGLATKASTSHTHTDQPIGALEMWLTGTPPTGYLICDGSAVSRSTYAALFALWGTTFGAGDGSTTFALPNMSNRFPLGKRTSGTGSVLGELGGNFDHVHAGPNHQHGTSGVGGTGTPAGGSPSSTSGTGQFGSAHTHPIAGNVNLAGTGNTDSANPPFMAVHFIVKAI